MFGRAKRVAFKGGRKKFLADRVEISRKIKVVKRLDREEHSAGGFLRPKIVVFDRAAAGAHGRAFDLLVWKGTQKRRLVVKKYNMENYPRWETQSSIAAKEFSLFQNLKKKGYHVPPTIRLVKIYGKKYVAMTDLSKPGEQQARYPQAAKGIASDKEIENANLIQMQETERAKKELGIDIIDSWEFVIDTKNGKISPFILDLGFATGEK